MRQAWQKRRLLVCKGEPDGADGPLSSQRAKGAIVVAGAVAEPMASCVEGQERNQNELGTDLPLGRRRFAHAEAMGIKLTAFAPDAKDERLLRAGRRCDRQCDPPAGPGKPGHQGAGVDLASHGPVARDDRGARVKPWQAGRKREGGQGLGAEKTCAPLFERRAKRRFVRAQAPPAPS